MCHKLAQSSWSQWLVWVCQNRKFVCCIPYRHARKLPKFPYTCTGQQTEKTHSSFYSGRRPIVFRTRNTIHHWALYIYYINFFFLIKYERLPVISWTGATKYMKQNITKPSDPKKVSRLLRAIPIAIAICVRVINRMRQVIPLSCQCDKCHSTKQRNMYVCTLWSIKLNSLRSTSFRHLPNFWTEFINCRTQDW